MQPVRGKLSLDNVDPGYFSTPSQDATPYNRVAGTDFLNSMADCGIGSILCCAHIDLQPRKGSLPVGVPSESQIHGD